MLERDRLSLKEYRDELEAEEREAHEREFAPIRKIEEEMKKTQLAIVEKQRERLLGKVRDAGVFVDPAVQNIRMTKEQADKFNVNEAKKYLAENPDVYWCAELINLAVDYWNANGIEIATASMFGNVIEQMRDAGLLPERPFEPEPEPVIEHETEPQPSKPKTYVGRDYETGTEREFTQREIDRMSSKEYRRAFQVAPTISDLFSVMSENKSSN